MPGDKVWLKNNHMNKVERWIEAKFVRRLSINIFQVAVGNVTSNAHRNQLKIPKTKPPTLNVMIPVTSNKRNRVVTVAEEDTVLESQIPSTSYQQGNTSSIPMIDPETILPTLRRSSRTKKRKLNKDFVYQ